MNRLEEIINTLKTHIGEGVEVALEYLETVLDHNSDRYNDYIQIKSRYNSLQRELLLGVLDHSTYDISRNNISKALLLLAEEISEKDLIPEGGVKEEKEDKHGEVLYHVPDLMQLNHEEKCTVRIAFEADQLFRDWEKTDVDVVKSIRVSEIMAVSMLNVDETDPPFAIRTLSETVQFLDKDDFTEWLFYVKPIRMGKFPLILRVSVIEMINNKEYKKDIVLEEEIIVQADEVPPSGEAEFKSAGTSITLNTNPLPPEHIPAPAAQAQDAGKKGMSRIAGALLTTAALAAAGYFGVQYYQEEQAWKEAKSGGGKQHYQRYLDRYPDGRHEEQALTILDSLSRADTLPGQSVLPLDSPDDNGTGAIDTSAQGIGVEKATPAPDNKPGKPAPSRKTDPKKNRPPAPKVPGKTDTKPPLTESKVQPPAPVATPLLRGSNFYFKIPRFSVVEGDNQYMDFKFYQFNQYREVLAVLGSQGGTQFQPGMMLSLIPEKGEAIVTELKYVAQTPDLKNRYDGYFTLTADELVRLSKERIKSVRVLTSSRQMIRAYNLTRSGGKNLTRRAGEALKQLEDKK